MKVDLDQIEQDFTTLDALAHYVARHLEDAASDDHVARRRFGRLVGLLAERAEQCSPIASASSPPSSNRARVLSSRATASCCCRRMRIVSVLMSQPIPNITANVSR